MKLKNICLFLIFPILGAGYILDILNFSLFWKAFLICLGFLLCYGAFFQSQFILKKINMLDIVFILWQLNYILQFVQLKLVDYGANLDGSLYKILAYGLLPLIVLLCSLCHVAQQSSSLKIFLFGVSFFFVFNVLLLPYGFAEESAFFVYGGEVSAEWGDVRLSLPSFPGVVSGAIFSGLICVMSVCLIKSGQKFFWISLGLSLYAVVKTETRSVLLVTSFFTLIVVIFDKRKVIKFSNWLLIIIFAFSIILPYGSYYLVNNVDDFHRSTKLEILTRDGEYGFSQFGGRSEIWDGLIAGYAPNLFQFLFGYGPLGEYTSGNAVWIAEQTGHFKKAPEVLHSHNAWMNLLYSGGVLYILFAIAAIVGVIRYLAFCARGNLLKTEYYALIVGIIFLIACAATESVLSIRYVYFTPFIVIAYAMNRYDEESFRLG